MTSIAGRWATHRLSREAVPQMVAILTAACVTLALATVIDTLATVVRLHSSLPYFDEWADLTVLRGLLDGTLPLTALFRQHNEHRIFFPRLVFYTDDLVFGGRGILDGLAIVAIQAAHALMLVGLLRAVSPRGRGRWAVAAVIVALLFCLRQEENFTWGFQVQFVGVFAGATLAFILFGRAVDRARRGAPSLALLCGAYGVTAVATFTMANGLLAAAVIVLLSGLSRAPRRITVASVAVLAVLVALYFHGYAPEEAHAPIGETLRHPIRLVTYAAVYLGNFLEPDLGLARAVGLLGLLALGFAAWRVLRGQDLDAARLALFGIMLFTAGTAGVTALGRAGFGLDQAFSSRYATGSATFWAAVLTSLWSTAPALRRPVLMQGAVAALALTLAWGAMRAQENMKAAMAQRTLLEARAADALLLGLVDPGTFSSVNDNDQGILDIAPLLKSRHMSVFGEADAAAIGRPVTSIGSLGGPASCDGSIDGAAFLSSLGLNGVSVEGHILRPDVAGLSGRTYIVDARDTIVGLAWQTADDDPTAWSGLAVAPPDAELGAVARLRDGRLCRLAQTQRLASP